MKSSLQSSRGLKTFQSRDFLNGIKGWEDLHLEFWCQTDWDIFLFLPSTSSLCSTERISFGTEIWRGYYYYSHHPHNPAPLSPGTRSPRRPAPRCPWWPDCSLLYASQCWPASRPRWRCGRWPGRWSLAARRCAGHLKYFHQVCSEVWQEWGWTYRGVGPNSETWQFLPWLCWWLLAGSEWPGRWRGCWWSRGSLPSNSRRRVKNQIRMIRVIIEKE